MIRVTRVTLVDGTVHYPQVSSVTLSRANSFPRKQDLDDLCKGRDTIQAEMEIRHESHSSVNWMPLSRIIAHLNGIVGAIIPLAKNDCQPLTTSAGVH